MKPNKGSVYRDRHPARIDRVFAVVWEGGKFVEVFSTAYRTSRISKKRLDQRYTPLYTKVDTNTDFVPKLERLNDR